MSKRLLTKNEIDDIVSFIKPNPSIPKLIADSVVMNNKNLLISQLENQLIYPDKISHLKETIQYYYFTSIIQPGESVGVIGAQSIGEKQTQTSISHDEKIIIKKNNKIINTSIGDFIDYEMLTNSKMIIEYLICSIL